VGFDTCGICGGFDRKDALGNCIFDVFPGDVDNDGTVTISDITPIIYYWGQKTAKRNNKISLSGTPIYSTYDFGIGQYHILSSVQNMDKCLLRADANGDGKVGIYDLNAVYLNLLLSHPYKDYGSGYCTDITVSREREREVYSQIFDLLPPGKLKDSIAIEFDFDLIPTEFSSFPNYPNPFNPITTIDYNVHKEADISITIHNIQGQLIINENFIVKPGYHSFNWNASNYASGIYFFNLYLDNEIRDTQQMLLVK
jgi:hypothetical protein